MKKSLFILLTICSGLVFASPLPSPSPGPSEEAAPLVTDGSKPNLPSGRLIGNSVKNARDAAKNGQSAQSSGSFFDDLSAGAHFSLTSFDDGDVDSKGHVDERAITLSGNISESTVLSIGYSRIKYRYGKFSPSNRIIAHGVDAAVHHSLNETFGIGGYAFFQGIDIERQGDSYTVGGGINFTSFHDLGFANLATATNLTYVDYDFDDDFIFIALADLSKDVTDWLTVGTSVSWTDSLTDNANNTDDNFWTVGADLRFKWDSIQLNVGWEKTYDLSDYKDNTLNVSLIYTF